MQERTTVTVERFTEIWIESKTDTDRLIPELLSVSQETNRRPDSSYYLLKDDKLIDPDSQRPVLDFIAPGDEYKIAEDIQDWTAKTDEGIAIWVSPKLKNIYPCNKALIYQIAYNANLEKVARYTAILFDGDIKNPEKYRKTLLTFEDNEDDLNDMLSWIEEVSGQKISDDSNSKYTKQASYFAQQIKRGVNTKKVVQEMKESGFLGSHSVSCPAGITTFSEFSLRNSQIILLSGERFLLCHCPFCDSNKEKAKVKAPIKNGKINCPRCGKSASYKC